MLRKVFLQTQFGSPHPWTEQYFDNVARLAPYGWSMIVFTPNPISSRDNVTVVSMELEEFDSLIRKHCGVDPQNFITEQGVPHKLVSDYYPAYGQIFQEYIGGADFWGHTNWDMVYGRLDHFLPDSLLETCDIWSDDVNAINGIFCFYRNDEKINNLFRAVPNWEGSFTDPAPCAFDEFQMTAVVRDLAMRNELRFKYPPYFGYHSYDRLIQHLGHPNIYFETDGALIERFEDPRQADICYSKGCFGREIMSFHFNRTKAWPL